MQQPDDFVDHMPFWWCYRAWKKHVDENAHEPTVDAHTQPAKECPHCGKAII